MFLRIFHRSTGDYDRIYVSDPFKCVRYFASLFVTRIIFFYRAVGGSNFLERLPSDLLRAFFRVFLRWLFFQHRIIFQCLCSSLIGEAWIVLVIFLRGYSDVVLNYCGWMEVPVFRVLRILAFVPWDRGSIKRRVFNQEDKLGRVWYGEVTFFRMPLMRFFGTKKIALAGLAWWVAGIVLFV